MKHTLIPLTFLFVLVILAACGIQFEQPVVESMSIWDGFVVDEVDSFRQIDILFSKPMNPYSVEQSISVTGYYGDLAFDWQPENRVVAVMFLETLEQGMDYTLLIDHRGCECAEGFDLAQSYAVHFKTYSDVDALAVVSTDPEAGETVTALDNVTIRIDFSYPIDQVTVYDKIDINPSMIYHYAFSQDRRTLTIRILEHVDANQVVRIRIDQSFRSEGGRTLPEDYLFSFDTMLASGSFALIDACFLPSGEERDSPEVIDLDTGMFALTEGIEKGMNLMLIFNEDFHLTFIEDAISIDPSISSHVEKDGNTLRFVFEEEMEVEETYRLTLSESATSVFGIPLERGYVIDWLVNGSSSRLCRIDSIWNIHPYGGADTCIFDGTTSYHNETLLTRLSLDGSRYETEFLMSFQSSLDIFRSLDDIALDYQYGSSSAMTGTLTAYSWDENAGELSMTFSLPPLDEPGQAYYKLVVKGGQDGVVDQNGNPMDEDIAIYVLYE